jgi:hypothetical protein
MAHARCSGGFLLLVHGDAPPGDDEWQAYLEDAARWLPTAAGQLVHTDGGGPTSLQRRALERTLAGIANPVRTAVVSSSRLVRGIVLAIGLFNAKIRVFRPDERDAALAYLRVSAAERAFVLAEVERLRATLG